LVLPRPWGPLSPRRPAYNKKIPGGGVPLGPTFLSPPFFRLFFCVFSSFRVPPAFILFGSTDGIINPNFFPPLVRSRSSRPFLSFDVPDHPPLIEYRVRSFLSEEGPPPSSSLSSIWRGTSSLLCTIAEGNFVPGRSPGLGFQTSVGFSCPTFSLTQTRLCPFGVWVNIDFSGR